MPAIDVLRLTPPEKIGTSVGMLFACWAIVIVLVAMALVFLRAGKKEYALAVLPLAITPFVHIFSAVLANALDTVCSLTPVELRVVIDLTGALIACLLIGVSSRYIQGRRSRNLFSVVCSAFIIILTIVLVVNTFVTR